MAFTTSFVRLHTSIQGTNYSKSPVFTKSHRVSDHNNWFDWISSYFFSPLYKQIFGKLLFATKSHKILVQIYFDKINSKRWIFLFNFWTKSSFKWNHFFCFWILIFFSGQILKHLCKIFIFKGLFLHHKNFFDKNT